MELTVAVATLVVTVIVALIPLAWRRWRRIRQRSSPLRVHLGVDTAPPWDVALQRLPDPSDLPHGWQSGPDAVHAVAMSLGGVAVGSLRLQLTLTNLGPQPVTVNDVQIDRCTRSDEGPPIRLHYPSGGGATLLTVLFDLDQEHPLPLVGQYVGGHLQLSGSTWAQSARQPIDPESSLALNVEARSSEYLTAFMLRLIVEVDGRRGEVLIGNGDEPFQLLGGPSSKASNHYVWRWDLGGIAGRHANELLPEWAKWRARNHDRPASNLQVTTCRATPRRSSEFGWPAND